MEWNYADLSKAAKESGGPEKLIQKWVKVGKMDGRKEMYPALCAAPFLGIAVWEGGKWLGKRIVERKKTKESEGEKMSKYYVKMIYPNGNEEMEDDTFDSYEAAEEHAAYCRSCYSEGAETLYMSNPGDYPYDEEEEPDYEILTEDEIEEWD